MRDWDYWRRMYIDRQVSLANRYLDGIESRTESPIESIALYVLEDFLFPIRHSVSVQTQVEIGKYRVDILVQSQLLGANIIIECDGHDFHERTKEQAAHDRKRDRYFIKLGYIVLRYTGSQICHDPYEIVRDVRDILHSNAKQLEQAS